MASGSLWAPTAGCIVLITHSPDGFARAARPLRTLRLRIPPHHAGKRWEARQSCTQPSLIRGWGISLEEKDSEHSLLSQQVGARGTCRSHNCWQLARRADLCAARRARLRYIYRSPANDRARIYRARTRARTARRRRRAAAARADACAASSHVYRFCSGTRAGRTLLTILILGVGPYVRSAAR